MKNSVLGCLFSITIIFLSSQALAGSYCEGYKDGYAVACKAATGVPCIVPICPVTPVRNIGEPQNDYKRGYLHGTLAGSRQ